jgi:hypothetical protein
LVVANEDERLRMIGIPIVSGEEDPLLWAQCMRTAQHLRDQGKRIIGLVPAGDEVAVPPLAIQLGMALVQLSGATVAYVDANIRWPAISELCKGATPSADGSLFATHWLRGSLALLTPPGASDAGAGVPQLRRVIEHGSELFAFVLVDLTGFDKLGEHLAAIDLVEGVIVVGRAGVTREKDMLRMAWQLPADRNLGVVLVGARQPR